MNADFQKQFRKKFKKLPLALREQFYERLELFKTNKFHPILNNHPLSGEYLGSRSINVTGSYRAIFKEIANETVVFYDIDTHPKLYSS